MEESSSLIGNLFKESLWPLELVHFYSHPIYSGKSVPHGNGAKVLLIPGLLASDMTLDPMRHWLERIGYSPIKSDINFHVGCPHNTAVRLASLLRSHLDPGEKAFVIGHSKGGLVAYGLSFMHPELIRGVIALGSPLASPHNLHRATASLVDQIIHIRHLLPKEPGTLNGCYTPLCNCEFAQKCRTASRHKVPVYNLFSKSDGVVKPQACIRPGVKSIEVDSSHFAMPVSPDVLSQIASILAFHTSRKKKVA